MSTMCIMVITFAIATYYIIYVWCIVIAYGNAGHLVDDCAPIFGVFKSFYGKDVSICM